VHRVVRDVHDGVAAGGAVGQDRGHAGDRRRTAIDDAVEVDQEKHPGIVAAGTGRDPAEASTERFTIDPTTTDEYHRGQPACAFKAGKIAATERDVWVTAPETRTVRSVDPTGKESGSVAVGGIPSDVAIAPDGSVMVAIQGP
jgi:hypothetical protein